MLTTEETIQTLLIEKKIQIAAPVEIVFESVLDELGPEGQIPGGAPFPRKLEPWPGGRWYRDLGNNTGHFWGHVQVIKPPKLLELCGPMFMSYPANNFVQYKLTPENGGTLLAITHRAMGLIPPDHRDSVGEGWGFGMQRIREMAERKAARSQQTRR